MDITYVDATKTGNIQETKLDHWITIQIAAHMQINK